MVGTVPGALAVLPMIVDAVGPTPVLAAGGITDGRGLAAALALGAQGARLGTRFPATKDSPRRPARRHGARPAQCLQRADELVP